LGTFLRNQHALGFGGIHDKVIARYPVSNGIDISLKIVKISKGVDGLGITQYLRHLLDLTSHLCIGGTRVAPG